VSDNYTLKHFLNNARKVDTFLIMQEQSWSWKSLAYITGTNDTFTECPNKSNP